MVRVARTLRGSTGWKCTSVVQFAPGVEGQAVAFGPAVIAGIEGAEAADQAFFHRTLGDLVGRVPLGRVAHRGDMPEVVGVAEAVAQHAVQLPEVLRLVPGAVVVAGLEGIEQIAVADDVGIRYQAAAVAPAPAGEGGHAPRQAVHQADAGGAGGGEVALFGGVGALPVADPVDQLGDQPVEVAVALAVGMARHVHRHAVDEGGEVGAVVQVEAAQEVLVRLTVAAVLGDDHPRHELQHLGLAQDRAALDQLGVHHALAGGIGRADRIVVVALHRHGGQFGDVRLGGFGSPGRCAGLGCPGVRGVCGAGQAGLDGDHRPRDRAKREKAHSLLLAAGSPWRSRPFVMHSEVASSAVPVAVSAAPACDVEIISTEIRVMA